MEISSDVVDPVPEAFSPIILKDVVVVVVAVVLGSSQP